MILARAAADAVADKKGGDVVLLDVADLIVIIDVFVIASGTSRPHVQSLAEHVEEHLALSGRKPFREEGRAEGEWVLLDYGDVVVHIFQPNTRSYYGLERLWGDADRIAWEPVVSDA
ncbi:MAG: ribosome silencing factor [Acidimicrobiia bacterium]